ncbi:MAG: nucleotidyltransferase [Patescibacteria group bacterium]
MSQRLQFRGHNYRLYTPKSQRREFRMAVAGLWRDVTTVIRYLAEKGIDPVVVGGLAVQHHGVERLTEDIDILISRAAYTKLVEEGKIKFGQLKIIPGTEIDVLTEGKDNNPDPEFIRAGDSNFPTFAGLIYLKLKANRLKDRGDVAELLKAHEFNIEEQQEILTFLPEELKIRFLAIWDEAGQEHDKRKQMVEE